MKKLYLLAFFSLPLLASAADKNKFTQWYEAAKPNLVTFGTILLAVFALIGLFLVGQGVVEWATKKRDGSPATKVVGGLLLFALTAVLVFGGDLINPLQIKNKGADLLEIHSDKETGTSATKK